MNQVGLNSNHHGLRYSQDRGVRLKAREKEIYLVHELKVSSKDKYP